MPTTTTAAAVLKPFLAAYAKDLLAAGFRVYVFKSDAAHPNATGRAFGISRDVGGRECYASVQEDYFGTVKHYMPIKPSRQHGSSMFVALPAGVVEGANVECALAYTRPSNTNLLVGTHANHPDTAFHARIYTEITA